MKLRTCMTLAALVVFSALQLWAGGSTFTTLDAPIAIPDTTGVFVCQSITVPLSPGEDFVGDVDVSIATAHSWVGDISYRLTSPSASVLWVMNRPGRIATGFGNNADLAVASPLVYNDGAVQSAEDAGENPPGTACGAATVVGTTCPPGTFIPAPDAGGIPPGVGTNLAQYTGSARNGLWTLCAADSAGGDTGTLSTWSLIFAGSTPVELVKFEVE